MNKRDHLKEMIRVDMLQSGTVSKNTLTLLCESRYNPRTLINEVSQ